MKTQTSKYLSFILLIGLLVLSSGLLVLAWYLLTINYEVFLHQIYLHFHFPASKMDDLRNEYITISRFQGLRFFAGTSTFLSFLLCYFLWKKSTIVNGFIEKGITSLCDIAYSAIRFKNQLSLFECWGLALTLIGVTILNAWGVVYYPLMNDEVFSYLYIVDKGFLVTSTYYPGPNNHIFYLQCCTIFDLFCNNPVWIMRLPALMASFTTTFCLLIYISKRFSFLHAVITCLIFSLSYNIFYYSIHGRGYVFMYLFFILATLSLLEFLRNQQKIYLVLLVVSNVLGLYSIPVFLYPLLSLYAFFLLITLLQKRYHLFMGIVISALCVIILTTILYSPILLVSGINSIIGNAWVTPLSFQDFWKAFWLYLFEVNDHLWQVSSKGWILTLLLLSLGTFILWRGKARNWVILIYLLLIVPFLVLIIQRVFPFMRVWDYLFFVLALLLAVILVWLTSILKSNSALKTGLLFLIIAVIIYCGVDRIIVQTEENNRYYFVLNQFMDKAFQVRFTKVYANEDTYALFFEFNAKQKGREVQLVNTLTGTRPDLIVIPSNSSISNLSSHHYIRVDSNAYVKAFKIVTK